MKNDISMLDFFKCISKLTTKDFNEKIDLFFKVMRVELISCLQMIDTDGNGMLSWDEVFELCQASLNIFNTG